MAHFAQIDDNDVVIKVIVVEPDVVASGLLGDPSRWIQTSYNTRGGIHYDPDTNNPSEDQSKALRKNYAGVGMLYDRSLDAFISAQPYPSWTLDAFSGLWEPPTPMPEYSAPGAGVDGELWEWDEETLSWINVLAQG